MIKDYIVNAAGIQMPEGDVVKITDKAGNIIWEAAGLPSEYQQVEWVQAAANVGAYIDLGFAYDTKATIEIGQWVGNTSVTAYPFGASENHGKLRCMLSCPYSGMAFLYGSSGESYGSRRVAFITNALNEFLLQLTESSRHITNITTGEKDTKADGAVQGSYTMTNHIYIFAQNYNGSPRFGGVRRINYFKYYDKNDELICDLIPCYRKSDGEIGMYDLARRLFLTNIGTETFTKGPDVNNSGGYSIT